MKMILDRVDGKVPNRIASFDGGPVVRDRFDQRKVHPGVEVATTQSKLYDLLVASLDLRNRRLRKDCAPCLAS